jgi:hypothetical protein
MNKTLRISELSGDSMGERELLILPKKNVSKPFLVCHSFGAIFLNEVISCYINL